MEPRINLTLGLSVVNAALNALEQQGHNVGNAIAAIKNQAVVQLQAGPQTSATEGDGGQMTLPAIAGIPI